MTQNEAVIETMRKLGGCATFGQLNIEVFKIKDCKWNTKTPFASIRRIVQQNKNFYRIRPGLWALEEFRHQLEEDGIIQIDAKNENSNTARELTHAYIQGILLYLGNMKSFSTYVPAQDKNKKCANVKLADIASLKSVPPFSYQSFVDRSKTIDVMWFKNNALDDDILMPDHLFEVEHSTDIQNSLLKFSDLGSFNTHMVIVADAKRKEEFKKKLKHDCFRDIQKRVEFQSYDYVQKQYEATLKLQEVDCAFHLF